MTIGFDDYLFPREQDMDVQLGDIIPDSPIVSVAVSNGSVYVQYGHENVGSVTVRLSASIARQLGWTLTGAATRDVHGSVGYVLTDAGREAIDA
jgi:hypothetical protein